MVKSLLQLLTRWSLERSTCVFHQKQLIIVYNGYRQILGATGEKNLAIARVDIGEVDPRDEVNNGWLIRVGVAAVNFDTVDTILMSALRFNSRLAGRLFIGGKDMSTHVRRTEDRGIPVRHHHVISLNETVRAPI